MNHVTTSVVQCMELDTLRSLPLLPHLATNLQKPTAGLTMEYSSSDPTALSPCSPTSSSALKAWYVGKSLADLPVPAAVIDRAKAWRNCEAMLRTVQRLNLDFRAHVKTHKVHAI